LSGVYITFDVECSMGGAWQDGRLRPIPPERGMMGRYGDRQLGLPWIVDILAESGLAATFFLEPFNDELGYPDQTEPICQYLLDRGQDLQLHVHPNRKQFALREQGKEFLLTDDITELEPAAQQALLAEGAERLAGWTGKQPVAYRAGNMAASEQTLEHLASVGIRIDSSYTFPYAGKRCFFGSGEEYNGSKWYGDVLEVALSGFRQPPIAGLHPAKPLDLTGISVEECRAAISEICAAGADAVMILHSFSLFKVRNAQYDGGRPNRVVARRFRRLCRWLAGRADDLPVRTFSQLADDVAQGRYEAKAIAPCRLNRPLQALTRKMVQFVNRSYWT